jgi:uncharacterized protein
MILTFILLVIAVCAVWIREPKISSYLIPLWIAFFIAALVSGVINHYVEWQGVFWIASFGLLSYLSKYTAPHRWVHAPHLVAIGLMALLIALGKFPGFHNPEVVTNMRLTGGGLPFTHRLPIDGILVGIILLAVFCKPVKSWRDWSFILRQSAPIILTTLIIMFGCGLLVNYVSVDIKFAAYTLVFLISNLLFTCVMEESFFRGFIQENLSKLVANWKYGAYFAVGSAALLFGAAHFKGGMLYVALATLAGLFYGYAKYRVKHIEAAILTHFSVNAVHFIAFTYPNL